MEERVSFLCVGTQKGGTTTLRAYLRDHPQLDVPGIELHFFDNEAYGWDQSDSFHYYHKNFLSLAPSEDASCDSVRLLGGAPCAGEVTPIYMYWLPSLQRIYRYNPNIRLIFLLRNPMARAFSHWSMEYNRGLDDLPFSDAIRLERDRCNSAGCVQHRVYSYIDRGNYFKQISRFLDFFPRHNMLLLHSESFCCAPHLGLGKISQFLGISDFPRTVVHHRRKGSYGTTLSLNDWNYMHDRLVDDISSLSSLVDWDVADWNVPWHGLR
jgi:hypothetical protein